MPHKNREERNAYAKVYYAKNSAAHKARVARVNKREQERIRSLITDFRADGCTLCPENEPVCLSAHHKNPADKLFDIGTSSRRRTFRQVVEELKKCVCVCHNCHAKIHKGILLSAP